MITVTNFGNFIRNCLVKNDYFCKKAADNHDVNGLLKLWIRRELLQEMLKAVENPDFEDWCLSLDDDGNHPNEGDYK